ncbi:MAG: hypothetical protein H7X95_07325, partial [Deltaproteobacteria bacterium]|nr:hypothetical protein [Deltaproteobacteria bacterium]
MHNARNAAAALAVASALGLKIPEAAHALAQTVLPPHRSSPTLVAGRIVLDDCYNANPASMRAALAAVVVSASASASPSASAWRSDKAGAAGNGRPFAILGDMLETGPDAAALHRQIGRLAGAQLAGLATIGTLGAEIAGGAREAGLGADFIIAGDDPAAAAAAIAAWSRPGDWVLVKASRGMRLERAVTALLEEFRKQPPLT